MKKKYLISGGIVALILLFIFAIKGIFPFGSDFISWGDMHAQILALYYNFYDVVYEGKSLFIDFTSGTVSNTFANFSYYIFSPFTLIILLFKRVDIPQAVGLIVLSKMVLSAITCNYFLDKVFKKLNNFYKIMFSVLYALSTYNLSLYIITGWIDVVYLFPLVLYGLYCMFSENKIKLFIISLVLSIIFNFYIALMCIVFIFFSSLVYLYIYKKDQMKKKIMLLGISVFLSVLCSSFILVPTIIQIMSSSRMGFNFSEIVNSRTGPITDKFMFLTSTSAMLVSIILIIKKIKINKKFFKFFIPCILLITLPLIIEPINKMLHFGSYVFYPYRYGFILILLLIVGACYSIEKNNIKIEESKVKKIIAIFFTLISNFLIIMITFRYYNIFQKSVDTLSFSLNHKSFFIMVLIVFVNFVSYFVVFKLCNDKSKLKYVLLSLCLVVFTTSQAIVYIKIDADELTYHQIYDNLNYIYSLKMDKGYHVKKNEAILFENFGFVSNSASQDFFTSLTDNNMFNTYQYLGYDSNWMNTSSSGSNIFMDGLLSNKYVLSEKKLSESLYEKVDATDSLYIYQTKFPISKGYILNKNIDRIEEKDSFSYSNDFYSSMTNDEDKIFEIDQNFKLNNLKEEAGKVVVDDKEKDSYFEKRLDIKGKKIVYFEMLSSHINTEKIKLYNTFDIYINERLLCTYPTKESTGSLYLGLFDNESVNIKLYLKKNISIDKSQLFIGLLDYNKLYSFFNNNQDDIDIKYNSNTINIKYDSDSKKTLFVPISYVSGMNAVNNNQETEIVKVFNSFIGIKINKGTNNISIKYYTPGLKIGLIISVIGLLLTIAFIKYKKVIIGVRFIGNILFILYLVLYVIMLIIFYIIPFIIFVISYI